MCFWRFSRHCVLRSCLVGDIKRRNLKRAARALLWPRNILPSSLIKTFYKTWQQMKPYIIVSWNCNSAKSSLAQPDLNVSKSDTLIGLSLRQPGNILSMSSQISGWWGSSCGLCWLGRQNHKERVRCSKNLPSSGWSWFQTQVALKIENYPFPTT